MNIERARGWKGFARLGFSKEVIAVNGAFTPALSPGRRRASPRNTSAKPGCVSLGIAAWLVALLCGAYTSLGAPVLQVPAGFQVEQVAADGTVQFPMFATLDPDGRLYVTESSGNDLYAELDHLVRKCRVSLLEDRDTDGRFKHSSVFAEKLAPCRSEEHTSEL